MRRTFAVIALVTWFSGAPLTLADPPAAALRLYAAGEFVTAADLADTTATASSRAFASRALVAACAAAQSPTAAGALLRRAETSARQALALDPRSVDARLQLALVYGMEGRRVSLARAFTSGYASRGKRLIDEALAIAPNNAHAHALLGAWHLEVVRRGGAAGAFLFGARTSVGVAEFERARTLAPSDIFIPLHFAIALLSSDAAANALRVAPLLTSVLSSPPSDALESLAQHTAERLRAAIGTNPREAQREARDSWL